MIYKFYKLYIHFLYDKQKFFYSIILHIVFYILIIIVILFKQFLDKITIFDTIYKKKKIIPHESLNL